MTYDVNRDEGCGGFINFASARILYQGNHGTVSLSSQHFRYVKADSSLDGDRFVMQGLIKDKPARIVVNVKFQ